VKSAPLLVGEVIAFVVDHEIDNCPVGQGCGLVENEPALLDARSESAHVPTVRVSRVTGKRSDCPVKQTLLDKPKQDAYTCIVRTEMTPQAEGTLPVLPCACANLRRTARAVTRMYNQELRATGLELTQFTLLMALNLTGETTQGNLGKLLALDTTSLTRMLRPLTKRGWVGVKTGDDRRQRLLRLTPAGRQKLEQSRPYWEHAQRRLQRGLGEASWTRMGGLLAEVTRASEAV
jgi:DNA-binding MarR family transcriptional regulator